METNLKIEKNERFRAFHLFFVIISIQIGVGILDAPRILIEATRQDAWISVVVAFIALAIVIATMLFILSRYKNADIFGIQKSIFGQFISKCIGIFYITYFFLSLSSIIITYINITHVFLFAEINPVIIGILFLILIVYSVSGGVRVVIGTVFIFSILSFWIIPLAYDPFSRMDYTHFFPFFNSPWGNIFSGAKSASYTFLGPEILFLLYPFVDNKKKIKVPVFLGITFSATLVLLATIISIGYFSLENIHTIKWPVISLYKSVSFSFMERFDYFIIIEWMMVVLTTAILLMWELVYSCKRIFNIKQNHSLLLISILLLFMFGTIDTNIQVRQLQTITTQIGFWLVYVYPLILLPIVLFKSKKKKNKETEDEKSI